MAAPVGSPGADWPVVGRAGDGSWRNRSPRKLSCLVTTAPRETYLILEVTGVKDNPSERPRRFLPRLLSGT